MANPQIEEGHLKVADGIALALCRNDFNGHELRIITAIMLMTYRSYKTKAQISSDDLRYATGIKAYRVAAVLDKLDGLNVIYRQIGTSGVQIIGLQKDWEKWGEKRELNLPQTGRRPRTIPELYLDYIQHEMAFTYTLGRWKREHQAAIDMYTLALDKLHNPTAAAYSLRDFFDEEADLGFRTKVRMPALLLLKSFPRYLRYLPSKPKSVRGDEAFRGVRFRWDSKMGAWQPTKDKLKENKQNGQSRSTT